MQSLNLNGNLVLNTGKEIVSIARESDFIDLVTYSSPETKFRALKALTEMCSQFGELRSPSTDTYRQRLSQLRTQLRMA